jgi:Domain of unknown function (DUF4203)
VAGVILIATGTVYVFIGLKNKWLHTYLSSAYLASLAVTVLILYVMNPPVSDAIQGAYLVAITMTGLILGGAALVFKEMTEGLACLLGGFCLAMWLLVLAPGGLLTSTGSISIFIASFTVVTYATSFNHYTRPYGLIGSISFGGATVVVLGIDCFSRAGLKEFWAYIWNLSTNLFPLGATTYPLTRGIRVEIAVTIVIFLAGIISQLQLWKTIQSRREQRAAERHDAERNLRDEESNLGQRIKHANARDRGEWEAVYGDKDATIPSRDSGSGSICSPKNRHSSTTTSLPHSSNEQIEMKEISSPPPTMTGAGLVMGNKGQDGGAIVRVMAEDIPTIQLGDDGHPVQIDRTPEKDATARNPVRKSQTTDEGVWIIGSDGDARPSRRNSKRSLEQTSGAPGVIRLPFAVTNDEGEDDRSSVATFADDDSKRLSKQFSQASILLRSLSKRSQRNSQVMSRPTSVSAEKLVIPHEDDDRTSIVATVDDMTDEDAQSLPGGLSLQLPSVEKYDETEHEEHSAPQLSPMRFEFLTTNLRSLTPLQQNHADATRVDLGPQKFNGDSETQGGLMEQSPTGTEGDESLISSTDPEPNGLGVASGSAQKPGQEAEITETHNTAMFTLNASLTRDSLPPAASKVVTSYRTNEWAKHLSSAEAPGIEELKILDYPVEYGSKIDEVPAPVRVEELRQTAESGLRDPALVRSVSQASKYSKTQQASRNDSYISLASAPENQYANMLENHSQNSLSVSQYNMRSFRNSSTPVIGETLVESATEDESPSQALAQSQAISSPARFTPLPFAETTSTTLLGKRDALLRSKSSLGHTSLTPVQDTASSSLVPSETNSLAYDPRLDDDNLSLSARPNVLRQSSLQIAPPVPTSTPLVSPQHPLQQPIPPTTTLPHRKSLTLTPKVREARLASWRASVQAELYAPLAPKQTIERHRSALLQGRSQAERERIIEMQKRGIMDNVFNERMRSGDMLAAHREAMRRMQQQANKHV